MRLLTLPTLNAAFISPESSMQHAEVVIREFADLLGAKQLLVRSDGGRECSQYVRGGNSYRVTKVITIAEDLLAHRGSEWVEFRC